MKKIMFNDRYGQTQSVLEGRKTMTRRIIPLTDVDRQYLDTAFDFDFREMVIIDQYSRFKVGEDIAVAQSYWDLRNNDGFYEALHRADPSFPLECIRGEKGCHNKMFVRADWMPHRIRITNIKVERLQDISEEDIYKEGFEKQSVNNGWGNAAWHWETMLTYMDDLGLYKEIRSTNPQEAFECLIDKLSGYGTWESNPWVFAYEFELVR